MGLSLGLDVVSLRLLLFQEVLSFLGLKTSSFAFLVVSLQVCLSLSCLGVDLSFEVIKLGILLVDTVDEALILLNVSGSSFLDRLEQLLIFSLYSLLLKLVLLNKSLHFTSLGLQVVELLVVFAVVLLHLLPRVISDLLSLKKGVLSQEVVFVEILAHVLELVKIPELSFLIVHNHFLLFLDSLDNGLHLAVEINVHALDVVSLRFEAEQAKELFFLLLKID